MSRRLTYEEVQSRIESRGYKLISKEYYRNSEKLDIECPKGHLFKMKLNDFSNGHGCPHCAGLVRHEYQFIKTQIEKEGFTLVTKHYKNAKQKLDMICPNGHECSINWNNFSNGFRCKKCNESKGEKAIDAYLSKQGISYESQHTFCDCKRVFGLPFDFYIPSLNTCIEFDGEHHFMPVRYGNISEQNALKNHELTKERDSIKSKYCLDNGIKLIRIPYYKLKDIDSILSKEL